MNPKVDKFVRSATKWQKETAELRKIILDLGLTEELKWGKPCYTFQESNILIIQGFKEYCALMFCKGALLKDRKGLLTKPGENTQAGRQLRFKSVQEITAMKATLEAYIREAIEAEKSGLQVAFKAITALVFPEELQKKFDEKPALKAAFQALTPGRQREYNLYFTAPKQAKTRESRIDKCTQQILSGEGLTDSYRKRDK